MTVLSQATSDTNRDRAFANLKAGFPSWEQVLDAPVEEVADAIRPGGIGDVKARRIQQILSAIETRDGRLDLGRLRSMDDDEITSYLCSLPGVGPKTAACVLLFSMGRDAFPVDTHVHRVAGRLGLIDPKMSAAKAHEVLSPRVPPALRYEFHMQLIEHGRRVCTPRRPRCSECVLLDLCVWGPELLRRGEAR